MSLDTRPAELTAELRVGLGVQGEAAAPLPDSKLGLTRSWGPVGLVGVGVGVLEESVEEGVGVGVLEEGVGIGVLEEGVGVGVSVLDEEDAEETMALVVDTAVDEELTGEMVEVAGTRVSIAKPRQDQRSFGIAHLRPTIDAITAACAVVLILEVAMPGTLTTHVTGGYTLSIICTCFVAALKAVGTHIGEIATVIICIAL